MASSSVCLPSGFLGAPLPPWVQDEMEHHPKGQDHGNAGDEDGGGGQAAAGGAVEPAHDLAQDDEEDHHEELENHHPRYVEAVDDGAGQGVGLDVDALRRLAALVGVLAVRMMERRDLASPAFTPAAPTGRPLAAPAVGKIGSPPEARNPAALQALLPPLWITVVSRLARIDPPTALTPQQFWQPIAKRGGWLARKHDGRPGWNTLWRGWHDVALLVEGAQILNRIAAKRWV